LSVKLPATGIDAGEQVTLCASAPVVPALGRGDRIAIKGRIRSTTELNEQFAASLRACGCAGSLEASQVNFLAEGEGILAMLNRARQKLTATLAKTVPGDSGALLVGLVTGDDFGLPPERRADFIDTGTSHVTAISGSNLALIATILVAFGGPLGIAHRRTWQSGIVATLWVYVILVGLPPPAFRAACVASLAAIAVAIGRRPDFVTLSVLVAAAQVLARPGDFGGLSYRLSTVAALALVLSLAGREPRSWRGLLGQGIFATAATQTATSALLVPTFGQFPLYAIPANLIIAPLCAAAFPLALLAGVAGFGSQAIAGAIANVAAVPSYLTLETASFFAGLPGASQDLGPSMLPASLWIGAGVTTVVVLSHECRRAIARGADALLAGPSRPIVVGLSGSAGLLAGLALGRLLL
jgi:competence protein ComEC